MSLKNKIFVSLFISLIFVIVIEYFFNCLNATKILNYLSISGKVVCLIFMFSLMVAYFLFFYTKDRKLGYLMPVIIFYAIYYIISNNQIFLNELFKLPLIILLLIIFISLFGLYHLVKNRL